MTSRLRTILRLLVESSEYTTIEQIAEATGAGIRTIHRDLERLERSLGLRDIRLERRRGYGVRLIGPIPENLMERILSHRLGGSIDSGRRPLMILLYLIAAGDWVKLSELAHVLFVSDSTISSDLSHLDSVLPESVTVGRQKGTGVRLVVEEIPARLLFLSAFQALFPPYLLSGEEDGGAPGGSPEDRLIGALALRSHRSRFFRKIERAERIVGYRFSPAYLGLLYAYLYLLDRRLPAKGPIETSPPFRLEIPDVYRAAAAAMTADDAEDSPVPAAGTDGEVSLLARILAASEPATPPASSVSDYLGSLMSDVNAVIEHTLSRIEERERVWLHDDRSLLNSLRMIIGSAARRIDLGLTRWRAFCLHYYPRLEDTPESTALADRFTAQIGWIPRDLPPSAVSREIQEASLALGARIETLHSRHATDLRVKILCFEGLGMSRYILALAQDVLPRGTSFDTQWEPDFEATQEPGRYDLVISTYPLYVRGARQLILNGDSSPDKIRRQLREAVRDLEQERGRQPEDVPPAVLTAEIDAGQNSPEDSRAISLQVLISVIRGFFVEKRASDRDLLSQTVAALSRGDCDGEVLMRDFRRRESYGSLVFEELNIRLLHCRTEGIPEPRAGVIQTGTDEPTVLVLAAPVSAPPEQTRVLSEIVMALTDYPDFPELLSRGSRRQIQSRLMTLFGRKVG